MKSNMVYKMNNSLIQLIKQWYIDAIFTSSTILSNDWIIKQEFHYKSFLTNHQTAEFDSY